MKRMTILFVLTGMVLLALAACGGGQDPLAGTVWQLVAMRDAGIPAEVEITAAFAAGRVSGSAGCNSYNSEYEVDGDKITFGLMAVTLMACPEEVMAQEQAFLDLMGQVERFELEDGQLSLVGVDGQTLKFEPMGQ